jgi:multidrug efflux system membrane fusion protein
MKIFRILIPGLILFTCASVAWRLVVTKPEARRFSAPPTVTQVEARRVMPTDYQVVVQSQGTVRARTESTLIPQVAGVVTMVSTNFADGGFFERDEILVRIEAHDYESAVAIAEAALVDARTNLELEQAQAEQALADWKRLGRGGEPSPLVLRKPQLARAQAAVDSGKARLADAHRDLDRTVVKAPYAGRILTKRVDIGQYVSPGGVLANIYAVDFAEIRLPLSNEQLAHVSIPESYRGETPSFDQSNPAVKLNASVGGSEFHWEGEIVRAEGAIDTRSRQLFVVAQVENPYGRRAEGQPPLKVGMFVTAKIAGKRLGSVFVVPRSVLRPGDEVLVVDDGNKLRRRRLKVAWRDEMNVIVTEGIAAGELVCLTQLPFAADGAMVVPDIEGQGPRYVEGQNPPGGGWKGGKGGKGGKAGKGAKEAGGKRGPDKRGAEKGSRP